MGDAEGVTDGVALGVGVGVDAGVGVGVGVDVGAGVGDGVDVGVGVGVDDVGAGVGDGVGVAVGATVALGVAVGSGRVSSFTIVPVPFALEIVAFCAPERVTVKVSSSSNAVSPFTNTAIAFSVSPALNVNVSLVAW